MKKLIMHSFRLVTLTAVLLAWTVPALAGGPFEPPDGVSNPSGQDYTGYAIYGYALGARDTSTARTRILCVNSGGVGAASVAVQYWDQTDTTSRPPSADNIFGGTAGVPIGDVDTTSSANASGTVPNGGLVRILVRDDSRKKNPGLVCDVFIEDPVTGDPLTKLDVFRPVKKKKKKR